MRESALIPNVLLTACLLMVGCRSDPKLGPEQHVVDDAKLLAPESIPRMDQLYHAMLRDTDVDLVVVSIPELKGESISDFANRRFRDWKIGSRTRANRGLLLVVSTGDKLVRLHTSYELESMLTDAFISYVEHQMMIPYFEKNMPGPGLEATAELVARRIYEKILNKTFDPSQAGAADIAGYRAGGGGVENPVPLGQPAPAQGQSAATDAGQAAEFGAQSTPTAAWEKFLEWNRRYLKDMSVQLFDDAARKKLGNSPYPKASQDHIVQLYTGKPYEAREEGDLAAIVFTQDTTHLLAPWFFKRGPQGWQVNGEVYPELIVYDHLNRWGFRTESHPYHFAFRDYDIRPGRMAKRRTGTTDAAGGGYLGATMGRFTRDTQGAYVLSLVPGAAAERSGLELGDLVTEFDGRVVRSEDELLAHLRKSRSGQEIRLTVLRGTLPREIETFNRQGPTGVFRPTTASLNPPKKLQVTVVLGSR